MAIPFYQKYELTAVDASAVTPAFRQTNLRAGVDKIRERKPTLAPANMREFQRSGWRTPTPRRRVTGTRLRILPQGRRGGRTSANARAPEGHGSAFVPRGRVLMPPRAPCHPRARMRSRVPVTRRRSVGVRHPLC